MPKRPERASGVAPSLPSGPAPVRPFRATTLSPLRGRYRMNFTRLIAAGAAAVIALGCSRGQPAPDTTASRDLQLAPAAPLDQYVSPQELGYQPAPGAVSRSGSAAVARPAPVRTVQRSSGAVYRAPQKVTHSRRDAAIGRGGGDSAARQQPEEQSESEDGCAVRPIFCDL